MKKLKALILVFFLSVSSVVLADEGMWLPMLLEKLNEKEMKSLGMKISAKDIYNVNQGSLKDAIVSFGGFCTGEVISSKGLVLTNHHCGFDAIQDHSTLEHNYIRDGFWARNQGEEIPNPDLFVTFIVRMEDVTQLALKGISNSLSEQERQSTIDKNLNVIKQNIKKESYQDVIIRPFFEGNQYYLFVTETYKDVRLVGAPPSAIGNFGKDTDNWMWPRHTGDFSMFRIYAGKDNKPAAYSPSNVPYTPKKALSISLDGVSENDFTMVFGFPGRTMQYLPSSAMEQIMKVNDPAKIAIREKALAIMDRFMRADEQIKIQYADKYASIQNYYKKWQGEVLGLTKTNAVEKRKKYEEVFLARVNKDASLKAQYGNLLNELNSAYEEFRSYGFARDYFTEIMSRVELFTAAAQLNSLLNAYNKDGDNGYRKRAADVRTYLTGFYKDYNAAVDQKLFETLMEMYVKDQEDKNVSVAMKDLVSKNQNDFSKLAAAFYAQTELDSAKIVLARLEQSPTEMINYLKTEPAVNLYSDLLKTYQVNVQGRLNEIQNRINQLQRSYMQAQMEVFKEKKFYPDANSTMRVTYGKVKGYNPRDAVDFHYHTYLEGIMEKYIPGDYEFDVPQKLQALYAAKDYGQYGKNGKLPVCFIATNHTTGGNSGSPALDASGNLIGLNFDRVWEGTMSDMNYDPSICRNIMVDIRYILFIVDKYAGAGHLVKEMNLVHPKGKF